MDNILITNFAASMFALLNPLGVLPIFISYTAGEKRKVQRWVALFLSLTVLVLLLVFFLAGSALLKFFGISLNAFRIAGGILLLIIGINLAIGDGGKSASNFADSKETSPLQEAELVYRKIVIPLAMPLLVGPGVIANVVLYATEVESHNNSALFFGLVATIIALSILIFAIFLSGRWLQKMVGSVGLNILTRILGLLVSSMGVQFMIRGLSNIIVHSLMPEILKVH